MFLPYLMNSSLRRHYFFQVQMAQPLTFSNMIQHSLHSQCHIQAKGPFPFKLLAHLRLEIPSLLTICLYHYLAVLSKYLACSLILPLMPISIILVNFPVHITP